MKTNHSTSPVLASLVACGLVTGLAHAQGNSGNNNGNGNSNGNAHTFPLVPSGWLSANPTIVQTGTKPTISWGINYPSVVLDYITVTPPSTVTANQKLDCEVRVLGAGVTAGNSSGFTFVPTEAQISYNGGNYSRIFYGTNLEVNPNTVVWSKKNMPAGSTLKFGGRYNYNDNWGTTYTSSSSLPNVRTLVNGQTPPTNIPEYNAPSLESFLRPHLGADGKVKIGPMDTIVFMELTHTDQNNSGYDLQDMVLLVTFKSEASTANNNGHGNNIDGIDSSNPGNAPFINLDTDPQMDDEGRGGGRP
jgi:hypothetical protein